MTNLDFQNKLIEKVNNIYNLKINKIESILTSWGNRVCLELNDDKGRFFLKEKPFYLKCEEYEQALSTYSMFKRQGLEVASILRTNSNNVTFNFKERTFCMIEWVEGNVLLNVDNLKDYEQMGLMCAKMAIISKELPKGETTVPDCRESQLIDISFNSIEMTIEILRENLNLENSYIKLLLNKLSNQIIKDYKKVEWNKLNMSWLHGDFHGNNIVKNIKLDFTIIDYDDLFWGYRILDVVWCCVIHSVWNVNELNVRENLDHDTLKAILSGYVNKLEITNVEKESFNYIFKVMIIRSLIEMYSITDETNTIASETKNSLEKCFLKAINMITKLENDMTIEKIIKESGYIYEQ
jgi:Ser/Thr protein kinase RdoA (MazF antagonist)